MRFSNTTLTLAVALKAAASDYTGVPSVNLPQGTIAGTRDSHNNSVFLGIPFAATTGGANRWKPPQSLPTSDRKWNATAYGPTCPQAVINAYYSQQDEDCLNLNIWSPADAIKQPVFVYMYGGAMVRGSSSDPQFQGNNFARKGVVYVSFNTRESIWAYPNSFELAGKNETQNFGILDVEKALEWVHHNIAAFGGDPDHIVFGGHSSGSVQVDYHLWNHPATWLKGAVQMSANAVSGPAFAPANVALDVVAAEVGCGTGPGQLECLRNVSIYDIQTTYFNTTSNAWFAPSVDNITRHADYVARFEDGRYASHVPLLTGNLNSEGTMFSTVFSTENQNFVNWINTFNADSAYIPDDVLLAAYDSLLANVSEESLVSGIQYGDARFDCAVDYLVDLRSERQHTWEYRFFGQYGIADDVAPAHGTEVPFFLGGNECFETLTNVTETQQALADSTNDWFVAWIRNPVAGPGWDKVQAVDGPLAKLGLPGPSELLIVPGATSEHNARCQQTYKPFFPAYPVVQSPVR